MKKQKVYTDLSDEYSNNQTTGLIIGEKGCFTVDKDFKKYKLIGIATIYKNPYLADTDKYYDGFTYYIPSDKANFEE